MKIASITPFAENKILVTVEGYPHAQPVFDATISPADLETALLAWQKNQDTVDTLNAAAKATPPPTKPEVADNLKAIIGKVIVAKEPVPK